MTDTWKCPYCGQEISKAKYDEIVAKISKEQEARLAELRRQHEAQIAKERKEADAKIERLLREAEDKASKQQEQARLQFSRARAEAEAARREKERLLEARRELMKEKASLRARIEAEMREKVREQVEAACLEQEKKDREELEKARRREAQLQRQVEEMDRRLKRSTQEELGAGQEEDLLTELQDAFKGDKIERIGKGKAGADLRQTVIENGKILGTIVYESKNVMQWSNEFVEKALGYRRQYDTEHVVIVSKVLPGGRRDFCFLKGIPIVSPRNAIPIAQVLRHAVVEIGKLRLSQDAREDKVDALYKYMRSLEFQQRLRGIEEARKRLHDLQEKEKDSHTRHWREEQEQLAVLGTCRRDIEISITSILEREAGKHAKILKMAHMA